MRNWKKRITVFMAALLCVMISGITASAKPATVATIGSTKYTSLDAAIKKVKNNGTIVLKKNVTYSKPLTINRSGKKFKINLNKHTITLKSDAYLYIKKGTVTISNGTLKQQSPTGTAVKVAKGAALNVSSGTYQGLISNAGTMTITKGTFTSINKKCNLKTCLVTNSGSMTIKGGTFNGSYNRTLDNSGTLKISGGTFKDTLNRDGKYAIENNINSTYMVINRKGSLTISGGNFKTSAMAFFNAKKAQLTIKKASVNCTNEGGVFCNQGTLKITNGTFKIVGGDGIFYNMDGTIQIKGGTFRSEWTIAENCTKGSIRIDGGTFTSDIEALPLLLVYQGKITVNGGTFTGKSWAYWKNEGASFSNKGGTFKTKFFQKTGDL